eukprot:gnl/Spiro4/16710_TR8992_c0_g1_i1.p1 gnl/Spiro4/16710_TR8992_c0_g1~~gnl/Spiro4/16710_TR8992_c0_g1_i1.p1  ORF type:complete len:120 (+),score=20.93 gnl/Spiro4/16710_TR8992_c0_g1_i1:77-436(+)
MNVSQFAAEVNGSPTSFVCSLYADRIVVMVTQTSNFGSIVHASADRMSTSEDGACSSFTVMPLLGPCEDLLSILARQLIECISRTSDRPLLLCVSLKRENENTPFYRALLQTIIANKTW